MGCHTVWWIAFLCKFKLVLLIYQLILNGFCSNMPDFEAVPIPTMEPAPVMVSTPVVVSIPVIPTQMSRCWYRGLGGQENQHRRRYRCRYHITLNVLSASTGCAYPRNFFHVNLWNELAQLDVHLNKAKFLLCYVVITHSLFWSFANRKWKCQYHICMW